MEKLLEKFNNKKSIENLVIFLVLCIIVMIVINTLTDEKESVSNNSESSIIFTNTVGEKTLETKLAEILSMINGAGKVDVMISYINEVEKIPMTDTKVTTTVVSEKDSNGGERKTEETSTEENIIYEETNNLKSPVVKQSILPEIVGVIVVAEGANNIAVKENLIKAVEATVNVPSHRIQVFSK
ncbi:MAG: stage III sporulation protein AG [Clostridia bacterium]|nr:stage III sporulation protein AG [Clostridia bacterium]